MLQTMDHEHEMQQIRQSMDDLVPNRKPSQSQLVQQVLNGSGLPIRPSKYLLVVPIVVLMLLLFIRPRWTTSETLTLRGKETKIDWGKMLVMTAVFTVVIFAGLYTTRGKHPLM